MEEFKSTPDLLVQCAKRLPAREDSHHATGVLVLTSWYKQPSRFSELRLPAKKGNRTIAEFASRDPPSSDIPDQHKAHRSHRAYGARFGGCLQSARPTFEVHDNEAGRVGLLPMEGPPRSEQHIVANSLL